MKILILLYYYHPYVSGLSLLAKMQAEGLAARGHSVTVLTTKHQKGLAEDEMLNGVRIVRAGVQLRINKGVFSVNFLRKIVSLARDNDVVNPHLPMAHFGFALPFVDTKKLVPQYHCDLNLGEGFISQALQSISYWSMERTLAKSSQIITTTNDYFSNCHFSKYASRAREIYPPIVCDNFGPRDTDALKAKLGLNGNPFLIGFVGRIVAEKGLEYLLQAIPCLEKNIDNFLILIVGDYKNIAGGSVKKQIDILMQRFPGRVKLVGHLKFQDLVTFYNLIDVLVLPSIDPLEAFGMVQVEAMLCNTPVIATDMPGVREVIRKTGFGRLVKKRDPQDVADKIIELAKHPLTVEPQRLTIFNYELSIDEYENLFTAIKESH